MPDRRDAAGEPNSAGRGGSPAGSARRSRQGVARFLDTEGRLTVYPASRRDQAEALAYLAERFEPGRRYTEREVNDRLRLHHTFGDWARLRRDMVDFGFLDRDPAGGAYWLRDGGGVDTVPDPA